MWNWFILLSDFRLRSKEFTSRQTLSPDLTPRTGNIFCKMFLMRKTGYKSDISSYSLHMFCRKCWRWMRYLPPRGGGGGGGGGSQIEADQP